MPFTISIALVAIIYSLAFAKKYRKALEDYNRSIRYDDYYSKESLNFLNRFESIALTLIMAMFVCFFIEC